MLNSSVPELTSSDNHTFPFALCLVGDNATVHRPGIFIWLRRHGSIRSEALYSLVYLQSVGARSQFWFGESVQRSALSSMRDRALR